MAGLTAPQFLQLPVGMRFMSSATVARIASIVCAVTCTSPWAASDTECGLSGACTIAAAGACITSHAAVYSPPCAPCS